MSGGDGRKALRLVIGAAESNPLYVASRFFHRLKYSVLLPTSESIESKGHGGMAWHFAPSTANSLGASVSPTLPPVIENSTTNYNYLLLTLHLLSASHKTVGTGYNRDGFRTPNTRDQGSGYR